MLVVGVSKRSNGYTTSNKVHSSATDEAFICTCVCEGESRRFTEAPYGKYELVVSLTTLMEWDVELHDAVELEPLCSCTTSLVSKFTVRRS